MTRLRISTRRRAIRWLLCFIVLAVALPWLGARVPVASAHANLVRSEPVANSVLPLAPTVVQLWFSEEPEPRFSEVAIYSSARVKLQTGPVQVAEADRKAVYVQVDALLPGTYTVAWKALSAVDGHTTAGAFAFAVGVGQEVTGPIQGILSQVGQTSTATPLDAGLRWAGYLAVSGLTGALVFVPLVLEPALAALRRRMPGAALRDAASRGVDASLWPDSVRLVTTKRTIILTWAAFWLTVGTTIAAAVVQAARAARVPVLSAIIPTPGSPLFTLLLETRYGQVWLGRILLLSLLAFLLTRLRATRLPLVRRDRLVWLMAALIGAYVPLTTSLNSHAAALAPGTTFGAPIVPIVADWVHILAASVWTGGLIQLVLAVPAGLTAAGTGRRVAFLAALVPAFSTVASISVGILTFTGTYQTVLHVGSVSALTGTAYGQALLVKLGLIAPLLLLALFNLLVARPRLAREAAAASRVIPVGKADRFAAGDGVQTLISARFASPSSTRDMARSRLVLAFRVAVGAEATLAVFVLLTVGVMTLSPPARDAWAEYTRGVTLDLRADDLQLRLRVNPGEPGFNTFALRVLDRRGRPVPSAEKVALIMEHLQHDMGQNELVLEPRGDGWYQTESGLTSMIGTWRAEALIRRSGRDDVRTPFEFTLGDPNAVDGTVPGVTTPGASGIPGASGTPGALATPVAPAAARALRNPIPATEQSLAQGRQIYQQNCMVCHGVQGRGDGPAARALRPPPADLAQHVTQHTEGELWWWITNGVPGTAMPAWKDALSETERWHVLNYIREAFSPATQ